ncbi:MAG: PD-(D/E)XK nuclease family protein [Verrucomicrobia bacterium]|nr:PD-(D/E)XK nuclease family protein [Verrucomicrobiota bacterium]
MRKDLLGAQSFELKNRVPLKRSFSFTGDLKLYETCPRQYQFFREYDFTPSRSAVIFFGLLVHQTIEEIHRRVFDGKLAELDEPRIRDLFDRAFRFLTLADVRPIGPAARESAFRQVLNYFRQNQDEMKRVVETEVDVSVEEDDYILTGKVDLLVRGDGKLELLDFKTSPKPADASPLLETYERQLCTYAHILEMRHGRRPEQLLLYWTAEERKADAIMQFPYKPALVDEAAREFGRVVVQIKTGDFRIVRVPERGSARSATCGRCARARECLRVCLEPRSGVGAATTMPKATRTDYPRPRKRNRPMSELNSDEASQPSAAAAKEAAGGMMRVTKTELVWPGKYNDDGTRREVPRVSLPFQVIETVNESRATREAKKGGVQSTLFDVWEGKEGDTFEAGWKNKLKDFVIANTELVPEEVRSKIKKWSDYIDYWAVDWDFQNDTFMQGWVAYRTRKDRSLPLASDEHGYEKPGRYRVLVKVVDIFGNDTTQAYEVEVK